MHTSTIQSWHSVGASHQTGWIGLVAKLLQPHTTERSTLREVVVDAAQSGGVRAYAPALNLNDGKCSVDVSRKGMHGSVSSLIDPC
jgi:hypothetical protein